LGSAYVILSGEISVQEIIRIKRDPTMRLTTSPFGYTPEEYIRLHPRYVASCGRMNWKGVKGAKFWEIAAKHGNLKSGLEKAIRISKEAAGVYGVAIGPGGKLMPAKCLKQIELSGRR